MLILTILLFTFGFNSCMAASDDCLERSFIDNSRNVKCIKLPKKLNEISGLTYVKKNTVACIHDEQGKIYVFNYKKKRILETIKISGKGDVEGICMSDRAYYIVESDGRLYSYDFVSQKNEKEKIHLSGFKDFEIEGITYNALNSELILALKWQRYKKGENTDERSIIAYKDGKSEVILNISNSRIWEYLNKWECSKFKKHVKKLSEKNEGAIFWPSGIFYNSKEKKYYVTSGKTNLIAILDSSGDIVSLKAIDKHLLEQPEGITIDSKGNIIVASEGSKEGKLLLIKKKKLFDKQ